MKSKNTNNEDILTLGEKQKEIQIKEEKKKSNAFPIFLMILGALLMLTGYFFQDIIKMLGIDLTKNENKQVVIKKENSNNLICTNETDDKSLGIETTITYTYEFNNKNLLQTLTEKRVIKPIENSDIGPDNLKIISGKYTDIINTLSNTSGLKITSNLNKNQLIVNIDYDYKNIDITKVPQNDKVIVTNTLNEELKSVKQKILSDEDTLCE